MTRVLVVEDDPDILAVLDFNLRREGFDTILADCGSRALRVMAESELDLVVLDLMLPDISGLDVCRDARRPNKPQVPIIILTARGQEADRLDGLECGADDYIVKPFSIREVLLRIHAVLRRWRRTSGVSESAFSCSGIEIDPVEHRVSIEGEAIALTLTEYQLLTLLLAHPGRVFSRQRLLATVWGMPESVVTRTVDTHVKRLREKLGGKGQLIETVRGVGYRLRAERASAS